MGYIEEELKREQAKLDVALSAIEALVGPEMMAALRAQDDFEQYVRDFATRGITRGEFTEAMQDFLANANSQIHADTTPPHHDKPYTLILANSLMSKAFLSHMADVASAANALDGPGN